jgi:hypothetical protein
MQVGSGSVNQSQASRQRCRREDLLAGFTANTQGALTIVAVTRIRSLCASSEYLYARRQHCLVPFTGSFAFCYWTFLVLRKLWPRCKLHKISKIKRRRFYECFPCISATSRNSLKPDGTDHTLRHSLHAKIPLLDLFWTFLSDLHTGIFRPLG